MAKCRDKPPSREQNTPQGRPASDPGRVYPPPVMESASSGHVTSYEVCHHGEVLHNRQPREDNEGRHTELSA
ncbi:hypothetical protein BaRGS_00040153 [Batillaria attramentaria]|uniref:Uncharacterized protein n=1 Tax=Batillaria attramentaria TaxID=370345 RepID=A0ABD0J196_9CAEN